MGIALCCSFFYSLLSFFPSLFLLLSMDYENPCWIGHLDAQSMVMVWIGCGEEGWGIRIEGVEVWS